LKRILVEGGAKTIARFIDAGLVDRLHVTISPLIIGSGPCGISLAPITELCNAQRPSADVYVLGRDILFDCHMKAGSSLGAGKSQKVCMSNDAEAAVQVNV
jgi:riboflavin biosynthesis pyrimidine reductase